MKLFKEIERYNRNMGLPKTIFKRFQCHYDFLYTELYVYVSSTLL